MSPNLEQTRLRLHGLLSQCNDEKCLLGGTPLALQKAQEAYRLALKSHGQLEPWRQLASYRIAHLMLRSGNCEKRLDDIDKHLKFAAGMDPTAESNPLGPLPAIFRLAVLHRLALQNKRPLDVSYLRDEIQRTSDIALQQVRRHVGQKREQSNADGKERVLGALQDGVFNLLELAAYFLGQAYAPLEGLGHLDVLHPASAQEWVLLGPDSEMAGVSMTRDFALAELRAREAHNPNAVILRLPDDTDDAELRMAGQPKSKPVSADWVTLLASLLRSGSATRSSLHRIVAKHGGQNPQAAFRKMLQRLRGRLQSLTKRKRLKLLIEDDEGQMRLTDELVIFGVAHRRTLIGS